ncbi:MAG: flagellar basal body rod protein FlgC [Thermaerobacterales bacterium]
MGLLRAMDSSASALTAGRLRLEVVGDNIANLQTTRTPEGGPYRRRIVTVSPRGDSPFGSMIRRLGGGVGPTARAGTAGGVQVTGIAGDPRPFKSVYDPGHPDADEEGYVLLPNIDLAEEMVNLLTASRSYEANVTAFNAAKQMALRSLDIGRG